MNPVSHPGFLLEHLAPADVQAALEAGCATVLIPCAAPDNSSVSTEGLALRVAAALSNTLVAPAVRAEPLDPQSADLTHRLADTCLALARQGFRYLIVLPGSLHPFAVSAMLETVQERLFEAELPAGLLTCGDALQLRRWQQEYQTQAQPTAEAAWLDYLGEEMARDIRNRVLCRR